MSKRIIPICCGLLLTTNLSYGKFFHTWKELRLGGFQTSLREIQTRDFTLGVHGIYNTSLSHTTSTEGYMYYRGHTVNMGVIGMANYLMIKDRFTASLVPTTGFYLDNMTLLHFGSGISYDSLYGVGIATQIMITAKIDEYMIGNDTTFGSVFLQWNYQSNVRNRLSIGISISSGSLLIIRH